MASLTPHQSQPTRHFQGIQGYTILPNGNILAVFGVLGSLRLLREFVSLYADVKLSTE